MKKSQIIILSLLMILMLGTSSVVIYALYTSHSYQKGVIATAREDVPLSSNYLHVVNYAVVPEYSLSFPMIEEEKGATSYTFDLTVNNFPLAKSSQSASAPITYDMYFDITNGSGTYRIARNSTEIQELSLTDGAGTIQFNTVTLKPGKSTDTYSITIPAEDLGKSIITTRVVPDAASLETVENKMLAAKLTFISSQNTAIFSYDSAFTDKKKEVEDLAAFNYNFSISTGRADAVLTWDTDYVELDGANLRYIQEHNCEAGKAAVTENGTQKKLEFKMDYNEKDSMDIIFYRTGKKEISSWADVEAAVSFKATEDTSIWND